MDPVIASALTALASGALAIGKGFADEAIKDGYKQLKHFIVSRFAKAEPLLDMVEEDPESESEQRVLAKQIAPAAGDGELKTLAAALLAALEARKDVPGFQALIDVKKIDVAKKFELSDIVLTGGLIKSDEVKVGEDFTVKGIRQGQPADAEKKT
ncbi:MAG TPA: hypothetical protein VKQ29_05155 [Aliidongia sp.]|nr:hypothetical protein [Aliidongia sp.]